MLTKPIKLSALLLSLSLGLLFSTQVVLAIGSDVRLGTLGASDNVYYGTASGGTGNLLLLQSPINSDKFRVALDGSVYINGTQICTATGCTSSSAGLWNNNGPGGLGEIYYNGTNGAGDTNIGIGTNDPDQELTISASKWPYIHFLETTNGTGAGAFIGYNANDFHIQNRENGIIEFSTNGQNERMRITSGGNVGIGTASPSSLLTLSGSAGNRALFTINASTFVDNGNIGLLVDSPANANVWLDRNSNTQTAYTVYQTNGATSWYTGMNSQSNNNYRITQTFSAVNDPSFVIEDGTGNVAIGKNVPTEKLDVNGNIKTSTHILSDAFYGTTGNGGVAQNIWLGDSNDTIQMQGVLNMNSKKITALATPTVSTDAATKGYVDGVSGGSDGYIGDVQTHWAGGSLNMNNNTIYGVLAVDSDTIYSQSLSEVYVNDSLKVGWNLTVVGPSLTVGGTEVCLSDGTNCGGVGDGYIGTFTGSNHVAGGSLDMNNGYSIERLNYWNSDGSPQIRIDADNNAGNGFFSIKNGINSYVMTVHEDGETMIAGNLEIKPSGYIDDDSNPGYNAALPGGADDWMKFSTSGYLEFSGSNDNATMLLHDSGNNGYSTMGNVDGQSYFAANNSMLNYFLKGNSARDVSIGRNLTVAGTALTVGGKNVCLQDGTNCPIGGGGTGDGYIGNTGTHFAGGDINMSSARRIYALPEPVTNSEPATKLYVDTAVGGGGGDNLGNHTATQDLYLSNKNIAGVEAITANSINSFSYDNVFVQDNLRIGGGGFIGMGSDIDAITNSWIKIGDGLSVHAGDSNGGLTILAPNTSGTAGGNYTHIEQSVSSFFMDSTISSASYFLKGDGRDVTIGGKLTTSDDVKVSGQLDLALARNNCTGTGKVNCACLDPVNTKVFYGGASCPSSFDRLVKNSPQIGNEYGAWTGECRYQLADAPVEVVVVCANIK